jgi:type I restriction-modification system DNA methylase subunit
LFTGDAGGGESNIRRYIIENWLEAIVQLPNNLFYNCRSHHLHLDTKQQNSQPQRQSATD